MKQQGLCHLKHSKWDQRKHSDWSDFIGWANQAIWLVRLLSLWRDFEKYFRFRVAKVMFLESPLKLLCYYVLSPPSVPLSPSRNVSCPFAQEFDQFEAAAGEMFQGEGGEQGWWGKRRNLNRGEGEMFTSFFQVKYARNKWVRMWLFGATIFYPIRARTHGVETAPPQ